MIQLNRIQLTSQTPNHVEITKILSTSAKSFAGVKVELLTASPCLEYASSEANKIHGYKIRFSLRL